jgi:DNA-binding response OmpR family regulator
MKSAEPVIFFVDNVIHRIFKTLEVLKLTYPNISIFSTEQEALDAMQIQTPDVLFLNLDLEPNDGVIMAREIRRLHPSHPPFIILYSDKQDDFVQELAFNSGVDSFIAFHNKGAVMTMFLKNLLKRRRQVPESNHNRIYIDADQHVIYKFGEALQLPRKEFRLFELLFNNAERFFSKPEIAEAIWQDSSVAKKRAIDVHIYNIRQVFGKRIIQSQKGKGYRINKKVLGV